MEYFDVLNEYGEYTGKVETREKCHSNGLWHRARYMVLYLIKMEMYYYKKEARIKNCSQIYGM